MYRPPFHFNLYPSSFTLPTLLLASLQKRRAVGQALTMSATLVSLVISVMTISPFDASNGHSLDRRGPGGDDFRRMAVDSRKHRAAGKCYCATPAGQAG